MKRARWDDMAAFLAVARAGGLAGATQSAQVSSPTLGRRMRALERAVGRELFIRRTHGYDLTEAGQSMQAALEDVAARIDRIIAPPSEGALPLVKISAGTWTTMALVRQLRQLAGDPPDLQLRFVSSETVLSIARREISIAVRNQRPTEPGLAGRKLGQNVFAVYAVPDTPSGWIVVNVDTPSARWARARAGSDISHEVSDPRVALDLALVGAGRVVLPTFIGDHETTLRQVSEPIDALTHNAWLVAHDDDRHLPEIRRVIERIVKLRS